jgi:hypothetical protein
LFPCGSISYTQTSNSAKQFWIQNNKHHLQETGKETSHFESSRLTVPLLLFLWLANRHKATVQVKSTFGIPPLPRFSELYVAIAEAVLQAVQRHYAWWFTSNPSFWFSLSGFALFAGRSGLLGGFSASGVEPLACIVSLSP